MEELLIKIKQRAKRSKIIMFTLLAALILITLFTFGFEADDLLPVFCLLLFVFFGYWIYYFATYGGFNRCIKWLTQKNALSVCYDINLNTPTLPKSKVFCGSKAMFFKKPPVIIPYHEIAWIYQHQTSVYGIPVAKTIFIFTRDGKSFNLKVDINEFQWLLSNYIMKMYPDIMIGYTSENQKRYKALYRKKR